jgi:hypothetical protein
LLNPTPAAPTGNDDDLYGTGQSAVVPSSAAAPVGNPFGAGPGMDDPGMMQLMESMMDSPMMAQQLQAMASNPEVCLV